jgi:hypothetical protein
MWSRGFDGDFRQIAQMRRPAIGDAQKSVPNAWISVGWSVAARPAGLDSPAVKA